MKVYIARYEPSRIGGGWSFQHNFATGLGDSFTTNYDDADVYFIGGATMVERKDVDKAFDDGKKIVLRVDNAVRNSRNRNTGMSRMYDMAQVADLVIYQSQWAMDYLSPFLGKEGQVILNGCDLNVFKPPVLQHLDYPKTYLYSRYNRDETKNWEVARYWFSQEHLKVIDARLYIIGQFSDELRNGNFDFYNGENVKYLGITDSPESMAAIYKQARNFVYTYYNDACSNSLIEALCCGCKIVGDSYYRTTGGALEIIGAFRKLGRDYFSLDRMVGEYLSAMEGA